MASNIVRDETKKLASDLNAVVTLMALLEDIRHRTGFGSITCHVQNGLVEWWDWGFKGKAKTLDNN
jgi:hypothetical protein